MNALNDLRAESAAVSAMLAFVNHPDVATFGSWLDAARAELAEGRAAIDAAMERLIEAKAVQTAEFDARDRELRIRESALVERETAAADLFARATALMRAAENRSADLSNRLHGIGA